MKQNKQKINRLALATMSLVLTLIFVSPVLASEINAENVVRYVNEARAKEGLSKLVINDKLNEVATAKVNDMVEHKYFAHTSPAGLTPWHWFELRGYDYKYAGENLAINFLTSEAQQVAWMNSPTHRKNILNVNYQEIGVAVAAGEVNGTTGIIAVQEFGSLATGASSDGKNFAPVKDKSLPDTTKFAPAVLSVGDNKIGEDNLKKIGEEITGPKNSWSLRNGAGNTFWLVLFILIALPLVIVQIVSIGKFMGLSWFKLIVQKSYESAQMDSTREYFRKLKVRDYGEYSVIKVKIVGV
ncbi:MAG: CAP domain-containing protein [Candidatus Moraniibacteriota bacterium]|jgi:hypothetical protein